MHTASMLLLALVAVVGLVAGVPGAHADDPCVVVDEHVHVDPENCTNNGGSNDGGDGGSGNSTSDP